MLLILGAAPHFIFLCLTKTVLAPSPLRGGLYVLLVPSHVPEVIVLSVFVLSDITRSHK